MIAAPVFDDLDWLTHGFGLRESTLPAGVRLLKQIHSANVFDAARCGPGEEGDALISREAGVIVGVKTADCVPVLLADPKTQTVAAIHAGWRGTVENVVVRAVEALAREWGARPADIRAAIGPSIGPCCYEVGPEVAVRFEAGCNSRKHIDLPDRNEKQLRATGVNKIWRADECTFCQADRFFSFRREGAAAGRMISFIGRRTL